METIRTGTVSDVVRDLVARQVDEHKLVVWYDPERDYEQLATELALPDTTVARFDGSFFALRHQIEPLLRDDEPPRLVVYVPLAEEATEAALVEVTAGGIVLKPGQGSLPRNTRLSVVARRALKDVLGDERAAQVAKEVEAGRLGLADLDQLAEAGGGSALLLTVFGTTEPRDVALAFLSGEHDSEIAAHGAVADLVAVLGGAYGVALAREEPLGHLRERMAQHVLTTDFIVSLTASLPPALATVVVAPDPASRAACVELARTWRLRRDLSECYATQASHTERTLAVTGLALRLDHLRGSETFEAGERALQHAVEGYLATNAGDASGDVIALARVRQSSFWSEQRPELQARWALIAVAGQLLQEARRIEAALEQPPVEPAALLRLYAEGERPWCLLDTHHRNLERRWHAVDFADEGATGALDQLCVRARQRYMDVGGRLAETFVQALVQAKFVMSDVPRQVQTFATRVRPALAAGKCAYLIVDALRFEMARELLASFSDEDYATELTAAVGTAPTITPIGMAALMPAADTGARVVDVGGGQLGLRVGDVVLKDRKARLDWLRSQVTGTVVDAKLEDLLPKPKRALEQHLRAADLVVVTSQEIDALAEGDNIRLARRVMDDILGELARLVHVLRDLGCATIIVTADHGYLFGDELDTDMKIDPPGGQTVDLHRRVWIGRGGAADPAYVRAPLAALGLADDDLEIAVPVGFGVFKSQGGARAYFHGGLAPQELTVPVLVLAPKAARVALLNTTIDWTLQAGSKKIGSPFVSIQVSGVALGGAAAELPRVRVELRPKGKPSIAAPVAASYGFVESTGDVAVRLASDDAGTIEPNTVTLMITSGDKTGFVSVHLLDATTGRELKHLDEPIELALLAY